MSQMRTHILRGIEGVPLGTLQSAFDTCVGPDYAIQAVPGFERVSARKDPHAVDDLNIIHAFWYDGGHEWADEEICVLAETYGEYYVIEASSDSSGWGCRQSMNVAVAGTLEDAVRLGMAKKYRQDLGYEQGEYEQGEEE